MSTSPLARRRAEPMFGDPIAPLEQHVEMLNGLSWVQQSGKPYFVGQRTKPNGVIEHFVDRKI